MCFHIAHIPKSTCSNTTPATINYRRRPRRPPFLLVLSDGVGVTSSILPIFIPARARARSADWAPGPGVLVPLPVDLCQKIAQTCSRGSYNVPPVARILTWRALMPSSLQRAATSCAANMAAYGEDSSRSALTFMPPVTLLIVSRPLVSPRMLALETFRHVEP